MCGLVGVAGNFGVPDEAVFSALLIADSVRGTDSTGAAVLSRTNALNTIKALGNPFGLLDTKAYDREVNGLVSTVFLGHNRYATLGKKTTNNAHPFTFGHICGAHNGTLESWSHAALDELAGEEYDVDSQSIFAAIEKVGIDETAKVMEGAWALSWIDLQRKKLCFWRNDERPLWYAYYGEKMKLAWASKSGMIGFAVDNAGQRLYKGEYYPFVDDTLYEWDIPKLAAAEKDVLVEPEKRDLKGKGGSWSSGYGCGSRLYEWEDDWKPTQITAHPKFALEPVEIFGSEESPYGGVVDEETFQSINKCKCSFCTAPMVFGEEGITIDVVNDVLLCGDCTATVDTVIYVSPVALRGLDTVLKSAAGTPPFTA